MIDTPIITTQRYNMPRAEGPWSDLALHSIGWKAFQDLCSQVCEVVLNRPVEIFREAQDDGQDAVFLLTQTSSDDDNVGTVQCKYSSDGSKHLRVSDITCEIENIKSLIENGQAHTYVFMTSMSVDAPVAVSIRNKLKTLGVRKPHILGKQFLVRAIRGSQRLRALVPQVYGLGDLTTILDQRFIEQTRALLGHWLPKMKLYVTTAAHRKAVSAISQHGIVLLLGNPSAGKSTIGAILSTIASEDMRHSVFSLTSPRDFEAHWNPNDPGRFFWIDDAFGANVVRDEFVQDWTVIFRKVQAAIGHGNKFLLTSRRYIYEAAKWQLGSRNLSVFVDGSAVVDVGSLSTEEKKQILYNHIRFGNQTRSWKRAVKNYLQPVAEIPEFLPGIAERLADPNFTKGLALSRDELIRFMREPREHLVDTINALDDRLRAGLILVYVHQGKLFLDKMDNTAAQAVSDIMGIKLPRIIECLTELLGSFLQVDDLPTGKVWQYAHPTISDALTDILQQRPYMLTALLRGATIDTVLGGFVCESAKPLQGATVIPETLDDILCTRLSQVPDEVRLNVRLYRFLASNVSDKVFREVIRLNPKILDRTVWAYSKITMNAKVIVCARALKLGILDESLRSEITTKLEASAIDDFDLSFLEDESIMALIPSSRLLTLGMKLRGKVLHALPDFISDIGYNADLDGEPDSNFEEFSSSLEILEDLLKEDAPAVELINDARGCIEEEVENLDRQKQDKEKEKEEEDSGIWGYVSSASSYKVVRPATRQPSYQVSRRSIFDDVDE